MGTEAVRNLAAGFNKDGTLIINSWEDQAEASADADAKMKLWIDRGGTYPKTAQMISSANEDATEKTLSFKDSISGLASAFGTFAEVSGALDGFAETIASSLAAGNVGIQAGETFVAGFVEATKDGQKNVGSAMAQMATGLIGGFGAIVGAVDISDTLSKRLLSGAASGAMVGAQIGVGIAAAAGKGLMVGGVWGAAAGAIVGIMVAVFNGRDTRRTDGASRQRVGHRHLRRHGRRRSRPPPERMFGGNHEAGTIFNLEHIIEQAGGLNATELRSVRRQAARRLRDGRARAVHHGARGAGARRELGKPSSRRAPTARAGSPRSCARSSD